MKELILCRLWCTLLEQDLNETDALLREHFKANQEKYKPPTEEFEELGFDTEDFDQLFETSIVHLTTINDRNTPQEKAEIFERAMKIAYNAYYSLANEDMEGAIKD